MLNLSFCYVNFGGNFVELKVFVHLSVNSSNVLPVEVELYLLKRWSFCRKLNVVCCVTYVVLFGGSERIVRIMIACL